MLPEQVTISLFAWKRSGYLSESLRSWSRARGVGLLASFRVSIDGGSPETEDQMVAALSGVPHATAVVRDHNLGVLKHPAVVLSEAFAANPGARFAVLTEEDVVVSSDVIEYLTWAAGKFEHDQSVIAVTANQVDTQPPGTLDGVRRVPWFQCWAWGTWRDRWPGIEAEWERGDRGWDWRLNDYWVGERGFRVIAPCVTRCQHIGREGGVHCTLEMFDGLQAQGFRPDIGPQGYRLVTD